MCGKWHTFYRSSLKGGVWPTSARWVLCCLWGWGKLMHCWGRAGGRGRLTFCWAWSLSGFSSFLPIFCLPWASRELFSQRSNTGKGHSASLKPNRGGPFYEKVPDTEKKRKRKRKYRTRQERNWVSFKQKQRIKINYSFEVVNVKKGL